MPIRPGRDIVVYVNEARRAAFESLRGRTIVVQEPAEDGAMEITEHTVSDDIRAYFYEAFDAHTKRLLNES